MLRTPPRRRLGRWLPITTLLFAIAANGAAADGPRIRLATDSDGTASVEVAGLDPATLEALGDGDAAPHSFEAWTAVFPVYTGSSLPGPDEEKPPVWGSYAVDGEVVRFTPRFPLVPGQPYSARWRHDASTVEATFSLPAPRRAATTGVEAIYPSAGELPENLLKIYLHFSAPMSRGEARRHLRLLDSRGEEVSAPFVAPEHELWNPPTDRLTLFLDPGRIKRGVGPNEELGPPLRRGERYRLVVDRGWRDARGAPLLAGFSKSFTVTAPDRSQPDPDHWRLVVPTAADASVTLVFPEPMDRALLDRLLTVVDGDGEAVAGTVEVGDDERRWSFRPAAPWTPGSYELRVGTALEDLAGNSVRRAFETDVRAPPADGLGVLRLPFRVRL